MTVRAPTRPRKRPAQARSRATVEAILAAAARVLVDEGFERATTNRVAEVAGVSIGSLYQYFPNKDALLATLAEHHMQAMLSQLMRMAESLADAPLEDAVRAYVRAMLAAHAVDPELHRVLTEQVPRIAGLDRVREVQAEAETVVQAYLEGHRDRLRPKDLRVATFVIVTSVEAVTHAAVLDRPEALDDEEFADEVTELVLRYLLA